MNAVHKYLTDLVGHPVVLDIRGPMVYLGTLVEVNAQFFVLVDADVHDVQEGRSTKETYVLDARKYGIRKNREKVLVRAGEVISVSKLEDVSVY